MKLISIIIPYHKKKKFIKKTLRSILNQSYQKFEIIIIYDDEDLKEFYFLQNLIKNDKRIKLYRNKKKLGAGMSRNKGVTLARGEYIAFIDADDLWKSNKLKTQLDSMIKNKVFFSHTSYQILYKEKILSTRIAKTFSRLDDIIFSCDIGLSTVMIKKKLFKSNQLRFPSIKTKEDFVLWIMILQKGYKILGIKKELTIWRKLDDSLSSSVLQKIKDAFWIYNKYLNYNFLLSIIFVFILSLNFMKKNYTKL